MVCYAGTHHDLHPALTERKFYSNGNVIGCPVRIQFEYTMNG
jgi:hypothetical protein